MRSSTGYIVKLPSQISPEKVRNIMSMSAETLRASLRTSASTAK